MNLTKYWPVMAFNAFYLLLATAFFLQKQNLEFMIYVGVIIVLLAGVFGTLRYTGFPTWMLWLFSFWGLMHVLGGLVPTKDGVLFAYQIFPFLDRGGDFYILKYDQVVHFYLYGLVAVMSCYFVRQVLRVNGQNKAVWLLAVLAFVGVSALNEIMEFFISLNMQNGVGGYENTLLDLCFNLAGAVIFTSVYVLMNKPDYKPVYY